VRPRPDARVSAPLAWTEIDSCNPADFTLATMPARFATVGDRHQDIDQHPGSLDALLELSARDEKEGLGDAPWPPQYKKQAGEPMRVQPSRARGARPASSTGRRVSKHAPTGRRVSKHPLLEIGRAIRKEDARAGFDRWKSRHPDAAAYLQPADVLVDAMRGRSSTWTRVRVNLQHVPEDLRPPQEPLDPDETPSWEDWTGGPQTRPPAGAPDARLVRVGEEERSGAHGVPARDGVGGSAGAKPPGSRFDRPRRPSRARKQE
jgi:hypothetical protein